MNKIIYVIISMFLLSHSELTMAMEIELKQSKLKQSLSDQDILAFSETPILKSRKRSVSNPSGQSSLRAQKSTPLQKNVKQKKQMAAYPFPEKITFWEVVFLEENKKKSSLIENIKSIGQNWIKTKADALDLQETHNPSFFLTEVKEVKKRRSNSPVLLNDHSRVQFTYMLPIIWHGLCYDDTFLIEADITKQHFENAKMLTKSSTQTAKRLLHWQKNEGFLLEEILKIINKGEPILNTPQAVLERNKPFTFVSNPDRFKELCRTISGTGIVIRNQAFSNDQTGDVAEHCEFSTKKSITMSNSHLRLPAIRTLKPYLSLSETLTELTLIDQNMGDLSALELFNCLPYSLEKLDLSGNNIGNVALIGLSSLHKLNQIISISLKKNFIGGLGVYYFFCFSPFTPEILDLSSNDHIDDLSFSFQACSFQKKLKSLNVSHTSIGDGAINSLISIESLGHLIIHNTNVSEEGTNVLINNHFLSTPMISKSDEDSHNKNQNGNWLRTSKI